MSTSEQQLRDAQLVAEALRCGDPENSGGAFPVLMRTFTSVARSVLRDSDLGEPDDLASELSFRFSKRNRTRTAWWATVPTEEAALLIRGYLKGIAKNIVAEWAKEAKRRAEDAFDETRATNKATASTEDRDTLIAVRALRELFEDPAHREGYVNLIQSGHGAASLTHLEDLLATRVEALGPYMADLGWNVAPRSKPELDADEARRDAAATGRDTPAETIASRVRRQLSRAREHLELWIDAWEKAQLFKVSPLDEAARARVHAQAAAYRDAALLLRKRSKSVKKTGDSQ
jgi:hypothetical protein